MGRTALHRHTHILVVISVVPGKEMHCYLEQYWDIFHKTWEGPAKHRELWKPQQNNSFWLLLQQWMGAWLLRGAMDADCRALQHPQGGQGVWYRGAPQPDMLVKAPQPWPLKICWDLKFCDDLKNRLGHKEEEKSNLGCWHSFLQAVPWSLKYHLSAEAGVSQPLHPLPYWNKFSKDTEDTERQPNAKCPFLTNYANGLKCPYINSPGTWLSLEEGQPQFCSLLELSGIWAAHAAGGILPQMGRKAWLLFADKIAEDRDVLWFPALSRPAFEGPCWTYLLKEKVLRKKECCLFFPEKCCTLGICRGTKRLSFTPLLQLKESSPHRHMQIKLLREAVIFPCPKPESMWYNLSWGTNYAKKGWRGSLHFTGKRHKDDIHSARKRKHSPPVSSWGSLLEEGHLLLLPKGL